MWVCGHSGVRDQQPKANGKRSEISRTTSGKCQECVVRGALLRAAVPLRLGFKEHRGITRCSCPADEPRFSSAERKHADRHVYASAHALGQHQLQAREAQTGGHLRERGGTWQDDVARSIRCAAGEYHHHRRPQPGHRGPQCGKVEVPRRLASACEGRLHHDTAMDFEQWLPGSVR